MDSPVRQQQKRNDYQRHKLFRKMKRRLKAKKEQEKELAEKELRRKLRMPKYADGKSPYKIRTNDGLLHDFSWNEEGNTILDDGTTGTLSLSPVVIKPDDTKDRLLNALNGDEYVAKHIINDVADFKYNTWELAPHQTELPANYELNRLIELINDADNPRVYIRNHKNLENDPSYMKDIDYYRAYSLTAPTYGNAHSNNYMVLGDPEKFEGNYDLIRPYIAELSHALQFRGGSFKDRWHNFKRRHILEGNNDNQIHTKYGDYIDGYNAPNNTEYEAHGIIEPAIWDYLRLGEDYNLDRFWKSIRHDIDVSKRGRSNINPNALEYAPDSEKATAPFKKHIKDIIATPYQMLELLKWSDVIPGYAGGKPAYKIRTNDGELHNFSFDKEGNTVLDNGVVGSLLLDDVIVRPGVDVRKAIERRSERLAKQSEMIDITDPLSKENYGHGSGALESVYPEFDLIGLGALINTPKGLFNLSKNIPTATKNTTLGSLYKDVAKDAHVDLFKKLVKNRAHQRMANIGNYTKDPILDLGLEGNVEHIDEIPSWVMEMFENTVIPRLDSKFINEHGGIEGIKKILNEGGYNVADEAAWRQLYGNNFAGFNYDTTNGIAIRGLHNVNGALPHEVRHRLQRIYLLLKQRVNFRKNYLNDAYGSDFANLNTKLPETDPLHNYTRFMDEAETTNLDSRNYLFDYYTYQPLINQGGKLYGAPLTVQNKIIDSATDELIIEAVRNANGYGRRYIEWIIDEAKRKNPNATIELIYKLFAPLFRNAMKYVPAFGGVAVATTTGEYKHGKAPGIHIKPENRGKFTALKKRTGHSASWFKAHGTPALKKMATFALNSRKWSKR